MQLRKLLPFALLVLAALLVAPSAQAKYRVGIGEQNIAVFDQPAWQSLKLKRVRYLVPWNWQKSGFDAQATVAFMHRARAARQDVLVTFTSARGCWTGSKYRKRKKACKAPSRKAYRKQFRAFDKQFPWVKTYSAWNEVNHESQPTYKKPRLAVRYYDVLRKDSRRRKFKVMAADMLDISNMRRYLRSFMRKAKGKPRLWGLHNYGDVNRKRTTFTRMMLNTVPGEVWLTETGGLVKFGEGRQFRYNERRAKARTKWMFKIANRYDNKRRGMRSKLTRLFVYKWFGEARGARFDAGLVDPDGSPRKAFRTFRKYAKRHR
jgi:hypothetical protein